MPRMRSLGRRTLRGVAALCTTTRVDRAVEGSVRRAAWYCQRCYHHTCITNARSIGAGKFVRPASRSGGLRDTPGHPSIGFLVRRFNTSRIRGAFDADTAQLPWSPEEARESVLRTVSQLHQRVLARTRPHVEERVSTSSAAGEAVVDVGGLPLPPLETVAHDALLVRTPAELTRLVKQYLAQDPSPPVEVTRLFFAAAARLAKEVEQHLASLPHSHLPLVRNGHLARPDFVDGGVGGARFSAGNPTFTTDEAYGIVVQLKRRLLSTSEDCGQRICASSYRSYLRVLVADRRGTEAKDVLSEMRLNGLIPGVASHRLVLRAVARQRHFSADGREKGPDVSECIAVITDAADTMSAFPSNDSYPPWVKIGIKTLIGLDIGKWLAVGWATGMPPLLWPAITAGSFAAGICCWQWTDAVFRKGTPTIMETEIGEDANELQQNRGIVYDRKALLEDLYGHLLLTLARDCHFAHAYQVYSHVRAEGICLSAHVKRSLLDTLEEGKQIPELKAFVDRILDKPALTLEAGDVFLRMRPGGAG